MSQGICHACKSGRFTQTRDLKHFKCADCGKELALVPVKRERVVLRGGKEKDYAITVEHLGVKEE